MLLHSFQVLTTHLLIRLYILKIIQRMKQKTTKILLKNNAEVDETIRIWLSKLLDRDLTINW